jgi:oligoribonuclease NrnB/cAMP/cGMP phosphodiesterase (DHH superfamily)
MEYEGLYPGILSKEHAACYLTWVYLNIYEPVPTYVQLLSDYDSWKNTKENWETEVRPLQSGMKLRETNPKYSMDIWRELAADYEVEDEALLFDIISKGQLLLEYDKKINKIKAGNSFVLEFEGYRCLTMNGPMLSSLAFESKWDPEKHDIMMAFYFKKAGHWAVTLYTNKEDINCEALAKKYGGGGHRSACGFQVPDITEILSKRKED